MANDNKSKMDQTSRRVLPAFQPLSRFELDNRRMRLARQGREWASAGRAWCEERRAQLEAERQAAAEKRKGER